MIEGVSNWFHVVGVDGGFADFFSVDLQQISLATVYFVGVFLIITCQRSRPKALLTCKVFFVKIQIEILSLEVKEKIVDLKSLKIQLAKYSLLGSNPKELETELIFLHYSIFAIKPHGCP